MVRAHIILFFFFFNDTATTEIYTLSLHDALPISLDEAHAILRQSTRQQALPAEIASRRFVQAVQLLGRLRFLLDRKSTRLNSSHGYISYAVFCLKKKKTISEAAVILIVEAIGTL